mgnify:CR=1 FL=1
MITNNHVRSIIRKEIRRSNRGDLCTEIYLTEQAQQGVLGLFSDLFAPLKNFYGNIWKSISSKVEGYYDGFIRDLEAEIKRSTGGETIDFKDPEHRKLYLEGMIKPTAKSLKEAIDRLEIAKKVEDWTPQSSSEEDLEAWKKTEDGKNTNAFFDAHGIFMGIADSFAPIADSISKAEKTGQGLETPTETAQWMNDFLKLLKDVENEAEAVNADANFSEVLKLADQCSSLVSEIASNMKKSTNEAQETYKKVIRAVDFVINERKKNQSLKVLKNRKRKLSEVKKDRELDALLLTILKK